jgi:hypothetical protein
MATKIPGILTVEMAAFAIDTLHSTIISEYVRKGIFKRADMHIVVMNPVMPYPQYAFKDAVLYSYSYGIKDLWEHPYDLIAYKKAEQSWITGKDGITLQQLAPHLMAVGDTPWYGSVNRDGMIVAVSGVQSYFDTLIAGWIADTCIAFCREKMQETILPASENLIS